MRTVRVGNRDLTLEDIEAIVAGAPLELAPGCTARIEAARAVVERLVASGAKVYGVTTGFGKLSGVRIDANLVRRLQENLILSHAAGLGEPLDPMAARLALALRIHTLAAGHSGVRHQLVDRLLAIHNAGIVPVIPSQGSVGASGDLAPLAHLALLVLGRGEALVDARRVSAGPLLEAAGIRPLELAAKEGISLVNGTQVSAALGLCALLEAEKLVRTADLAAACTLEAIKGSLVPFDERIQALRPHPGQIASAANVRALMASSEILISHADCSKVQDAYSLRCVPQVHGAVRDQVRHCRATLLTEANAVSDNPLVFAQEGEGVILSGGNFHGEPVAMALDALTVGMAELASISERRIETMVNPDLSGLPPFLVDNSGLNSGMMLCQVTAAAIVSENKTLAHPASVDSIPTSAGKEDHVSMSTWAGVKCRRVVANAARVLAIELMCAAQGLEFSRPLKPGDGVEAAYAAIRRRVAPLEVDRVLAPDIEAVLEMVDDGTLLAAVVDWVGELA